jgi:hypothetical protein
MRTTSPTTTRRTRPVLASLLGTIALVAGLVALVPSAGADVTPTATVNGTALAGDGGKLDGCTLAVVVDGLPADPAAPTTVAVAVAAVSPTAPEGAPIGLVDDSDTTTAASWSHDYPMDALVAPLPISTNGYRLRVTVAADGTGVGSGTYWLACGASQDGNPTRILFDVRWVTVDGTALAALPPEGVAEGWATTFLISGTSKKGTATCTYPAGSSTLACVYDNPGHGSDPGLVVPGNPEATYRVAVGGVPDGWLVDPSTVGTFVGRDVCPRGGGGHGEDDGGGEVAAAAAEGPFVCTHTVVLVQQPGSAPSTPDQPGSVEAADVIAPAPAAAVAGSPRVTG